MEWIKKYLLEGKFAILCPPFSQPNQAVEIKLLLSVFASEL